MLFNRKVRLESLVAVVLCLSSLNLTQAQPTSTPAASSQKSKIEKIEPASDPKEEEKFEQIPDIVVTATRTATAAGKTSASVTVINKEEITTKQYHSIDQALRSVPGVTLASSGVPGQLTGVFVRGAKTENTSILVDGRRLPFNLAGSYSLESLTTDNIERIEIVRGPLSAAQGGPASGGVINIITRDGRGLEKPESSVKFEAGSYGTFQEAVASRGSAGPFDWSVGASRLDTENQRANNQYRLTNWSSKFGVQATKNLYLDIALGYGLSDAGSPNNVFRSDPAANLLRERWTVSPGATWQTTDTWKQSLFYSHSQQRQVAESFPAGFFGDTGQNNRVQANTDQMDYQSEIQIFEPWKLTVGTSVSDTSYYRKIDVENNFAFPVTPAGTRDIENSITNTAIFIQSQVDITQDWAFVSSLRLDHYSDFGTPITYRLGTSYRTPFTDTLLRASYGTAFSPPTPQDLAPVFGGSLTLKAERSESYEIGIEQPLWDEKILLTATWFHSDVKNPIVFDPNTFTATNAGTGMNEGVELGFKVKPFKKIQLAVNYTYLTSLVDFDVLTFTATPDTRQLRRPRHALNAQVGYHPIPPLRFGLEANYVADREDNDPSTFGRAEGDDYLVMRLTAAWDINSTVQIFGRVENLTGAQHAEAIGFPALDTGLYGGVKVQF